MITTTGIRATGLYLLEVLNAEKAVDYSRFYNATRGTDASLAAGAARFVDEPECCRLEELRQQGHVMLEYAADQLKDLGIVRMTPLDQTLIDGEHDYRIEFTADGESLANALKFQFRDPDYSIVAKPASEWLIELALAGFDRETFTLRDVIEGADSDGDVVIYDDCENEYHLGTMTYAWAFEVSLWHHARSGHVVAECQNPGQKNLWADFVGQKGRPFPADIDVSRPLWDIPFRIADAVRAGKEKIRHVGRVS